MRTPKKNVVEISENGGRHTFVRPIGSVEVGISPVLLRFAVPTEKPFIFIIKMIQVMSLLVHPDKHIPLEKFGGQKERPNCS